MSKLSSFLEKKVGISKSVQKGITAVAKPLISPVTGLIPMPVLKAADVFKAASAAAAAPSPVTGVVPPGNTIIDRALDVNKTFNLTPIGGNNVTTMPRRG